MKLKHFTLFAIIIFCLIGGGVILLNRLFPPTQTGSNLIKAPIVSTSTATEATNSRSSSAEPSFTADEVAQHNSKEDCYLIIRDSVYNVTDYISFHPGGRNTIIARCGREVTGIFTQIHSNRAWDLLGRYKIGQLGSQAPTTTTASVKLSLDDIYKGLVEANPGAEIVNVKPSGDNFIAKIILDGKFYEAHIDQKGRLTKVESEGNENWSTWDTDSDDL